MNKKELEMEVARMQKERDQQDKELRKQFRNQSTVPVLLSKEEISHQVYIMQKERDQQEELRKQFWKS
jgi:hypothetical protein